MVQTKEYLKCFRQLYEIKYEIEISRYFIILTCSITNIIKQPVYLIDKPELTITSKVIDRYI